MNKIVFRLTQQSSSVSSSYSAKLFVLNSALIRFKHLPFLLLPKIKLIHFFQKTTAFFP